MQSLATPVKPLLAAAKALPALEKAYPALVKEIAAVGKPAPDLSIYFPAMAKTFPASVKPCSVLVTRFPRPEKPLLEAVKAQKAIPNELGRLFSSLSSRADIAAGSAPPGTGPLIPSFPCQHWQPGDCWLAQNRLARNRA